VLLQLADNSAKINDAALTEKNLVPLIDILPAVRYKNSMSYVSVGFEANKSIDIYYEDCGAGDPIILIHAWPLASECWEKQRDFLIDEGYRVITYDRRGFGRSSRPLDGYDYDTLAGDLQTLIAELNLTKVTLVGYSMGGGEVARYIGKYGSRQISKTIFVASVPPRILRVTFLRKVDT
jgi:non-heme chloroperoxidase